MVVWSIWCGRNAAVREGKVIHPAAGVSRSLCFSFDFKVARFLLQPNLPVATNCTAARWQKPLRDVLKINRDTSV